MKGYLISYDGRRYLLPDFLSWRLEYTAGVPCDSFTLTCLWAGSVEQALADAVRFLAEEAGKTVFTGVVDEYAYIWDTAGSRLTITGRGLAALLLDNEAQGTDYLVASPEDIVQNHVKPYGIQVAALQGLHPVEGFTVASGSSEWQAVYTFANYHSGITPRFNPQGQLILAPWQNEKQLLLDHTVPITGLTYRDRRYGVLSEVLVRDKSTLGVQRVTDADFQRRGGQCRRVITMPGKSSYQAMRYSGAYQLARSREDQLQVELTVPQQFFAWPGDLLQLRLERPKLDGLWRVRQSAVSCEQSGGFTRLTLGNP